MIRRRFLVEGVVQGVGFRPFVHALAVRRGLSGHVRNEPPGVVIEVEGEVEKVVGFRHDLLASPPPGARVEGAWEDEISPRGTSGFRILASRETGGQVLAVSPDLATCPDCLRELRDPGDRRFRYPFLACARCGPRFTIVRAGPYDRKRTTMAGFPMCAACIREYQDPTDRRFHAQAVACPACGPRLRAERPRGGAGAEWDPLRTAVEVLRYGGIVAVKGLGGFHLACDARSRRGVARLRRRKARDAKPFAVMVRDIDTARRLAFLAPAEEELLSSPRRPIVLARRRDATDLAPEVAPGLGRIGLVLPYTPLHQLLLEDLAAPVVMTSGNRSGESLAFEDEEARTRLGSVADLLLLHDRPIRAPVDDSVFVRGAGGPVPLRRARGWVPAPISLPSTTRRTILALGGHLKSTFCFVIRDRAVVSQHMGDLDDLSAVETFRRELHRFAALLGAEPEAIVHDLHPDYRTTRFAGELSDVFGGVPQLAVQHHHAHALSCLAEHGRLEEDSLAVVFDGSGYGPDGTVWGGEFLVVGEGGWRRAGHLANRALPGGEAAVREPWRMAAAHLDLALGPGWERRRDHGRVPLPVDGITPERLRMVLQLVRGGGTGPATSSVGRLFDAVAALLGIRGRTEYEGQAAMELEARADSTVRRSYPVEFRPEGGRWVWDPGPMVEAIVRDRQRGATVEEVAGAFHNGVRDAVVQGCARMRGESGVRVVALSGGVFQNVLLLERCVEALGRAGFHPLVHRKVPPNDGGLSLGQAAAAVLDPERLRFGTRSSWEELVTPGGVGDTFLDAPPAGRGIRPRSDATAPRTATTSSADASSPRR